MVIGFNNTVYEVGEDSSAVVTVSVQEGILRRPVEVVVFTSDGTAMCKWMILASYRGV